MSILSVKIPGKLEQRLAAKAEEMEITVSALVRTLLDFGLDNFEAAAQKTSKHPWQKKLAAYNLMTYFLLESFVTEGVENGEKLIEKANQKSGKVVENLFK